jgi:hypothetical protein
MPLCTLRRFACKNKLSVSASNKISYASLLLTPLCMQFPQNHVTSLYGFADFSLPEFPV